MEIIIIGVGLIVASGLLVFALFCSTEEPRVESPPKLQEDGAREWHQEHNANYTNDKHFNPDPTDENEIAEVGKLIAPIEKELIRKHLSSTEP